MKSFAGKSLIDHLRDLQNRAGDGDRLCLTKGANVVSPGGGVRSRAQSRLFWSSGLAAIAALVARTLEYFGQLDFAVNNACVALDGGAGIAKYERNFRPDNEHQRAQRLFHL